MKLNTPLHDKIRECTEIKKQPLTSSELRISEQFGQILNKFRILHHGWEMDGYGYVVENEMTKKLIVTEHSKPLEMSTDYLRYKISEYKNVIKHTEEIIKIIEDGKYKI